jgi:sugar phosphate isomerase/epimerase
MLQAAGIAVSNLLWAGGFTGSDGHTYRESIEDAVEAIRLAALLRAGCLVVYSGGRSGHTANHARRLLVGALTEIAPVANEHGVTLAVEPMHASCAGQFTFLYGIDETLEVLDRIDGGDVKLVFDTYHLCQEPLPALRIAQIAPRVAVVHLGDGHPPRQGEQNRCRLGDGAVPLAETMRALAAGGYDGDYDVELLGEELEACDYTELLRHTKSAFARLAPASG